MTATLVKVDQEERSTVTLAAPGIMMKEQTEIFQEEGIRAIEVAQFRQAEDPQVVQQLLPGYYLL